MLFRSTHGAETFVQGVQNSCNPVFMIVAERLGAEIFANYINDSMVIRTIVPKSVKELEKIIKKWK